MLRTKTLVHGLLILALSLLTACVVGITIGGQVKGLAGNGLVLQNNGGDDLAISADGSFTFATPLPKTGGPYAVTIKAQPSGQVCTVSNGSGTAIVNVTDISVQCVTQTAATLQLLAGGLGGQGNLDGTGGVARFYDPRAIAVDGAGNAYVADSGNHTIRKITPAGDVTTLAGMSGVSGSADGTGAAARFHYPAGIALDSVGNLYVADSDNATIRKITPAGEVTTLAGAAGSTGSADGSAAAARFNNPNGIALDGAGNAYVADTYNHAIRKITPAGVVTTLAGSAAAPGNADGTGAAAGFYYPKGITVDGAGNVYVTDSYYSNLRKISPAGVVTTLSVRGGFSDPVGVALDGAGNLYVAGSFNIQKVSPAGGVTILAGAASGYGSADGFGTAARFYNPRGIALDSAGNVYAADSGNHTIRKISSAGEVTTLAGKARSFGSTDGTGAAARFNQPSGVALDSAGNAYVADYLNCTIRKVSPAGEVTTLAGTTGIPGSADGTGAAAMFAGPIGVAVDSADNVYVADIFNHAIRKISPAGVVTTLAGTLGSSGSVDGTGAAARFNMPMGVALDGAGNVYVAEYGNHTIRRISPAGAVTTVAGLAGWTGSADGAGTAARFNHPWGIALDGLGNAYVADTFNHTIRRIATDGAVTTLAGVAGSPGSADGTGAAARFNKPGAIALDGAGNAYVADAVNGTMRKVSSAGAVSTVIGDPGKLGVQLGALPGTFNRATGVAVFADKLLLVAEDAVLWAPMP